jgi:hypothetical protein
MLKSVSAKARSSGFVTLILNDEPFVREMRCPQLSTTLASSVKSDEKGVL